nr:hypothetical protein BaRGS_013723 [Batillaria attramentaria]
MFCGLEKSEDEIRGRCSQAESPKAKATQYCFKDGTMLCGYCNAKVYACVDDPANPKKLENNYPTSVCPGFTESC